MDDTGETTEEAGTHGAFLVTASKLGWEIVAQTEFGIQLRRRRVYPKFAIWCGVLLAIVAGFLRMSPLVGVLAWAIGGLICLSSRDEMLFATDETMRMRSTTQLLSE